MSVRHSNNSTRNDAVLPPKLASSAAAREGEFKLNVVGPTNRFPKVSLIEPKKCGYLLVCLEVEHCTLPIGYMLGSENDVKKRVLGELKEFVSRINNKKKDVDEVQVQPATGLTEAVVFKAIVIPPGGRSRKNRLLQQKRLPNVPKARFDVVVLFEFDSVENAKMYRQSKEFVRNIEQKYCYDGNKSEKDVVKRSMIIVGSNVRRMGDVDHDRDGVFLFNYFVANNVEQNLKIWEHTAGWFWDQTGLENSTLILPEETQTLPPNGGDDDDVECPHSVINHCRWDNLKDILPSLLLKRSFKTFVLDNFEENNTAATPILYKLA